MKENTQRCFQVLFNIFLSYESVKKCLLLKIYHTLPSLDFEKVNSMCTLLTLASAEKAMT